MREGKARQFASGRAIFLGYHSAMPEKVVPGAIMTKIGQGQPGPSESGGFCPGAGSAVVVAMAVGRRWSGQPNFGLVE